MGKLLLPIGLLQFAALRPLLVWKSGGGARAQNDHHLLHLLTDLLHFTYWAK